MSDHSQKLLKNPTSDNPAKWYFERMIHQTKLLAWKRYVEVKKSYWEFVRILGPPFLFFVLCHLAYATFDFFSPGGVEPFLVPFAFFIFAQRIVLQIMYEKSNRLQEAMKMMGLLDSSYWLSYFLVEAIITGFVVSFMCAVISGGVLFNDGNFGEVLGFLFAYCLAVVPFCFFISCFFDTPQTAGQATLGVLLGSFVIYIIVFLLKEYTIPLEQAQLISCLVPPVALQLACGSFLRSHQGLTLSQICGMMVADVFIYSTLTWYFYQTWPSKLGVQKPFYFPLLPSYWFGVSSDPRKISNSNDNPADMFTLEMAENEGTAEKVNEKVLGNPSIIVKNLKKTFGNFVAVDNLSFKMYENQIFALLGHNGAGKTTTISMLTGLTPPDHVTEEKLSIDATIYGKSIIAALSEARLSMGVCPQHDVLFDNLTVREHILFFAQLKGASYEAASNEAEELTKLFHLEKRLDNTGEELSGGQKRKLSVGIAVCGGSKFVVLDEPTAGMDPLARRELWDLLSKLRKGRTMLLTTHYMDEADVLGDRVGIMAAGKMICLGSTQFLKLKFGSGYKLILEKKDGTNSDGDSTLITFVKELIPSSQIVPDECTHSQSVFLLPYSETKLFGKLFHHLDNSLDTLSIKNYGLSGATLEDVFLRVDQEGKDIVFRTDRLNIGSGNDGQRYTATFTSQVVGVMNRKLSYAFNDFSTIPLLLLPIAAGVAASAIYSLQLISDFSAVNAVVCDAIYTVGYLGIPGILAEFVVRERNDKLKNVLNVMGCNTQAYWVGTWLADVLLLCIPAIGIFITWFIFDTKNYYEGNDGLGGLNFFILFLFNFQISAFAYLMSFIFVTPKSCVTLMPMVLIGLIVFPSFIFSLYNSMKQFLTNTSGAPSDVVGSIIWWSTVFISPQGGLYGGFLASSENLDPLNFKSFPPPGASIAIMFFQIVVFMYYTIKIDEQSIATLEPVESHRVIDEASLDSDVAQERKKVLVDEASTEKPLKIERLRKIYPPVQDGGESVVAVDDICLSVNDGEVFGLLGANGAGKTSLLSMLTRLSTPTSGTAAVANYSILTDFRKVATNLGVVTQNNSLWDRLSVENHLYLFARLRGVPEEKLQQLVDECIEELELSKHRKKLAMRLSGGMKRKLCVAIALIGDPRVVLLDEPSAGLDPVSRRNLWSVILRTMSHRSVILTTHSMEEAEVLCHRIGIMVQGQLQALGSKQHLKFKFGSGFELVVKIGCQNIQEQTSTITAFLHQSFPSATIVYENGGLVTFQLAASEAKMSLLFSTLEENKDRLFIESYSIAQPTLEQVFIRIVQQVTGCLESQMERQTTSSKKQLKWKKRLEMEKSQAKCGCSNFLLKIMAIVFAIAFVVAIIIGGVLISASPTGASISIAFGILFVILSIVMTSILCCSCCRIPIEE